jgi:uncharacterized protein (TIGR02217 family)
MAFHEVRFPTTLSFGSVGGPERRTEIVTLANGFEERNTPWAHARRRYDAGLGLRNLDDVEVLIAFFEARQGQVFGFRWKDWSDYKSSSATGTVGPEDQEIGVGDAVTTDFQLVKAYASGQQRYIRPIAKPVAGTVKVALAGSASVETAEWSLDPTRGIIRFVTPPGSGVIVTAGFEFDVPVRFDTDRIQTSVASFQAGDAPSVPVVEVRL